MALMFLFGSTRPGEEVQRRYDNAYVQCMYAKGGARPPIPVDDPYNMYFTPDDRSAIVSRRGLEGLDFRDPHTMALPGSTTVPRCAGVNHADFAIDSCYVNPDVRVQRESGEARPGEPEPHGLTVRPQPGRYALGHTGNLR
jgi:hypothetical protein